ncbi:lysylphosphatidylglycerol synthase domain-containing protein [Geomonas anaerohicana]|uniref:Flippase-like domain-containing protein n=1 Tax=Geomonas anaerohicana TaxID=2798583 RepID=A0ABS0YGL5_9BACT|nr:lysylphosphatidylglycerol synthase domain-containing protein [Geomonas anaerohicana]MBJ6751467.1 flippase-like domain-containing protein [Geomonas anaerohicana]
MPRRTISRDFLSDLLILGVILACSVFLFSDVRHNFQYLEGNNGWPTHGFLFVLAAMGSYAVAHLLRSLRLWLILGSDRIRFSTVFGCHATIALLTFAAPFKLGDLLRASEFYRLLKNDARGIFAVWFDRLFDVAVILVLLIVSVSTTSPLQPVRLLLFSLGAFLAVSVALGVLLPGAVAAFMRALLQSSSSRSLSVMRSLLKLKSILSRMPKMELQTLSLLTTVTFAVWGLELLSVFLLCMAVSSGNDSVPAQAIDILAYTLTPHANIGAAHFSIYRLTCNLTLLFLVSIGIRSYFKSRMSVLDKIIIFPRYSVFSKNRMEPAGLKGRLR